MSRIDSNGEKSDPVKRYEGYTDYQSVSNRVARSVDRAIEAYTELEALDAEYKVKSEDAAYARRDIHAAALRLVPEIKANKGSVDAQEDGQSDVFDKIHKRWIESGDEDGGPYLERIRSVNFTHELPDFIHQLVMDIRMVAWETGYLQAGRTVTEDSLEPADEQAREMFE